MSIFMNVHSYATDTWEVTGFNGLAERDPSKHWSMSNGFQRVEAFPLIELFHKLFRFAHTIPTDPAASPRNNNNNGYD